MSKKINHPHIAPLSMSELKVGDVVTYTPTFFEEHAESVILRDSKRKENKERVAAIYRSIARRQVSLTVTGINYTTVDIDHKFAINAFFLQRSK